jgi:hypothetical protein
MLLVWAATQLDLELEPLRGTIEVPGDGPEIDVGSLGRTEMVKP